RRVALSGEGRQRAPGDRRAVDGRRPGAGHWSEAPRYLRVGRRVLLGALQPAGRPLPQPRRCEETEAAVGLLRRHGPANGRQQVAPQHTGGKEGAAHLARRFRRPHLPGLEKRPLPAGTHAVPGEEVTVVLGRPLAAWEVVPQAVSGRIGNTRTE